MSRTRIYHENTIKIQERFFAAYEECRKQKLIPRAGVFFDAVGTYPQHFYNQRKDLTRGFFQPSWMVPLVRDCGVSANWLLTGQGFMFSPDPHSDDHSIREQYEMQKELITLLKEKIASLEKK